MDDEIERDAFTEVRAMLLQGVHLVQVRSSGFFQAEQEAA